MLKIGDLPKTERPRERLSVVGPAALSVKELLEIILSQGSKESNVSDIADNILLKFASLPELLNASLNGLCSIKGIGAAKAAQLKACLELGRRHADSYETKSSSEKPILNSFDAFLVAKRFLQSKQKEHLLLFCLSSRGNLLSEPEILSIGTLDSSLVHPREIFHSAIKNLSSRILLAHNHPSGQSLPSGPDIEVTKQIYEAGKIIGISLVDHIVIGQNEFSSIAEIHPEIFLG